MFAASFRFEMSKRRLNYLSFDDVIVPISLVLIDNWMDCGPSYDVTSNFTNLTVLGDGQDQDKVTEPPNLDKDFLTSLRDLKVREKLKQMYLKLI